MSDTHLYKRGVDGQYELIEMQPLDPCGNRAVMMGCHRPVTLRSEDKYLSTIGPLTFSRDASGSPTTASATGSLIRMYRGDPRLPVGTNVPHDAPIICGDAGGTRCIRSTSSNGTSYTVYGSGSCVSFGQITRSDSPPRQRRPPVPPEVKDESRQRVAILGADTYDPVKHAYTPAKFQEMCKAAVDVMQCTWNIGMYDRLDVSARGLPGPDHVAVDLMKRIDKSGVPPGGVMLSLYPPIDMTINCRYASCCDKGVRLQADHVEFSKAIGRSTIDDFKQLRATRLVVPDDWNPHSDAFSSVIAKSNFVIVFYHTEAGRVAMARTIPAGVNYVTIDANTLTITDNTIAERTQPWWWR